MPYFSNPKRKVSLKGSVLVHEYCPRLGLSYGSIKFDMSKGIRTVLWVLVSIVLIGVVGWKIFTYTIGAMGTPKCSNHRVWKVGEYDIVEKQCLGFAGPHYYPVYLFKGGVEISMITYLEDSCEAMFVVGVGDTLVFDLCANRIVK
mgnify:FL=1